MGPSLFFFKVSHVHSDTHGRNSSESNMNQTALFVNSFQGFPWSLSLHAVFHSVLNEMGCFYAVLGLVGSSYVLWTRAVTQHVLCICLCSCNFALFALV